MINQFTQLARANPRRLSFLGNVRLGRDLSLAELRKHNNAVVLVDEKYCLGCRYCIQACPYGCRFIHPEKNVAQKCTLCYHRITKGLTTACCEACPTSSRMLADLKNPNDPIHEFMKKHSVQVLKPQMATGAKAFYANLDGAVR